MRLLVFKGIILLLGLIFLIPERANATNEPCLDLIAPLAKNRDTVRDLGGMWTLLEQTPSLQKYSRMGLQVDSEINKMIFRLKYLCNTRNGVPLNDLAEFVTKNIKKKGVKQFMEEQVSLGKPKATVEIWVRYSEAALKHQHRKLKLEVIRKSISQCERVLKNYLRIAQKLNNKRDLDLAQIEALVQQISKTLNGDPYLSLAKHENSQVPFWDVDENYGGS